MYQLKFDISKQALLQINPDGQETVIADDSPSEPVYSIDQKKAIYISPLEWECMGSLYLYSLENGQVEVLVKPDSHQHVPKYAIWINDQTIALIIGFAHGTIHVGGNVFSYHLSTGQMKQITHYPSEIQVTKLTLDGENLILEGIQYTDDHLNEFKQFKSELSMGESLSNNHF